MARSPKFSKSLRQKVEQLLVLTPDGSRADHFRELGLAGIKPPPTSTYYHWRRQWLDHQEQTVSTAWSIADDATGQSPAIARVLAAVVQASSGRRRTLTIAEATWIGRLAAAFPLGGQPQPERMLEDARWDAMALFWRARDYVEASGDADRLATLDVLTATNYYDPPVYATDADFDDSDWNAEGD